MSFKEFKKLTNQNEMLDYARNNFKHLAKGGARIVYEIDNDKVLKIVIKNKNNAILARWKEQNKNELNISQQTELVAKVLEWENSSDILWVLTEKVSPCTNDIFEEYSGVPYQKFFDFIQSKRKPFISTGDKNILTTDAGHREDIFERAMKLSREYHLALFEMAHEPKKNGPCHWGINKKNDLVMLDYGITWEYLNKFHNMGIKL